MSAMPCTILGQTCTSPECAGGRLCHNLVHWREQLEATESHYEMAHADHLDALAQVDALREVLRELRSAAENEAAFGVLAILDEGGWG